MYLTRKYHLGTLFFTFPTGNAAAILHDHPSYAKQYNRLQCKGSTLVFKVPGIEPATSALQSSALSTELILLQL